MEKIILRSIMYGADKIPDAWFDRVPGGYYKSKQQPRNNRSQDRQGYGRYNEEDDDEPYNDQYQGRDESKRRDSHRDRGSSNRDHRRHSMSDGPRNSRRSYEDDHYAYDDRQKNRYDDDDQSPRRNDRYPPDHTDKQDLYDGAGLDPVMRDQPSPITAAVAGGFAAGVEAAHMKGDIKEPASEAGDQGSTSQYGGYVPYSNIYGEPRSQNHDQSFSPPPSRSIGSPQPHSMNQVSPPRRGNSAERTEDRSYYPQDRSYRDYDRDRDDRDYNRADDRQSGGRYADDRSRGSRSRRPNLRSRSYDSYDSQNAPRRNEVDRRQDRSDGSQSKNQLSSRLSNTLDKTFDKSQRGLQYGAIGALAGGLIGSEAGKGAVPAVIGAGLGAIGANIFEAREKYVDQGRQQKSGTSVKKTGRKEKARNTEFARDDGMRERRDKRERERRDRDGDWKN